MLIGGYTGSGRTGLELHGPAPEGWALLASAPLPNPSWLVPHPSGRVLAVLEDEPSGVVAVEVDDDALRGGEVLPLSGTVACHAALVGEPGPGGQGWLVVAHYGSGSVSAVRLAGDGTPAEETDHLTFSGSGPDRERQEASHAHQVVAVGGQAWVSDLGSKRVHRLRLSTDGSMASAADPLVLPAGFGPRHLALAGDRVVVCGELSSQLLLGHVTDTGLTVLDVVPASTRGAGYPSALRVDHEGLIWSATRGPDTLAVHRVDGDRLVAVAEVGCGGAWPRDVVLEGERVLVANQSSGEVSVFARSAVVGPHAVSHPEPTVRISTHAPSSILPTPIRRE